MVPSLLLKEFFERHPIFKFPLKWNVCATFVGGGPNFTVFNYEHFSTYMAIAILSGFVKSLFWIIVFSIIWGLLIGWIVAEMAGHGMSAIYGSEDVLKP